MDYDVIHINIYTSVICLVPKRAYHNRHYRQQCIFKIMLINTIVVDLKKTSTINNSECPLDSFKGDSRKKIIRVDL